MAQEHETIQVRIKKLITRDRTQDILRGSGVNFVPQNSDNVYLDGSSVFYQHEVGSEDDVNDRWVVHSADQLSVRQKRKLVKNGINLTPFGF